MKIPAALLVVVTVLYQPSKVSPRDLLNSVHPLTRTEIAAVLAASQRAIGGKTFRLANIRGGSGPDILMGRNGIPRRVRWSLSLLGGIVGGLQPGSAESGRPATMATRRQDMITITDYTGRSTRDCTRVIEDGELVVEYRFETVWTTTTRLRRPHDFGGIAIAPIFEMLQGVGTITTGELQRIGTHSVRAFVSAWTRPEHASGDPPLLIGDPIPNLRGEPVQPVPDKDVQTLWIDTRTLLPVRWEVSEGGRTGFIFNFDYTSIDMRLPKGVHPRGCVQ